MKTPVREIMTSSLVLIEASTALGEVVDTFIQQRIHGAPVVDGEGKLLGVLSMTDVLRVSGIQDDGDAASIPSELLKGKTAADVMTPRILALDPDDTVRDACNMLLDHHVHRVVVVQGVQPIGMVSSMDLIRHFAESR